MAKTFTLAEVAAHKSRNDLWMVIDGKVYEVTKFLDTHPGGEEVLVEQAGLDASEAFEEIGHSDDARKLLEDMLVGEEAAAAPKRAAPAPAPSAPKAKGSSFPIAYILIPLLAAAAAVYWQAGAQ